jgi:hypothetical protein
LRWRAEIKQAEAKERAEWDEYFAENAEWLQDDLRHGYVYFLRVYDGENDHIKIGWARDVRQRIRELQTGCPYQIELVYAYADDRAQLLEALLHRFCEEHRGVGEWHKFGATYEEIEAVVVKFEEWAKDVAAALRAGIH